MIRRYFWLLTLPILFVITLLLYQQFLGSHYFPILFTWAVQHTTAFIAIIIIIKIVGIIWPPLPGLVFTMGAIPILGWFPAYLSDAIGSVIGSTVAFWIARLWGVRLLQRLLGKNMASQITGFRLNRAHEFEALLLMRIFGGSISEIVSYGSGVSGARFSNFLGATVIANIVVGMPLFYLVNRILTTSNWWIGVMFLVILTTLLTVFRKRYFVYGD